MNELLKKILDECYHYTKQGKVANYIPELSKANTDEFGICVVTDIDSVSILTR